MKDSNLQVVSDWLVSNQLQYHYGNTAKCFSIYRHISRSVFTQRRGLQCYTWRIGGVRYELTNPKELIYSQLALSTCISTNAMAFYPNYHRSCVWNLLKQGNLSMPKNGIEPFPVSLVVARFWPLFPMSYIDLTAIWRLATIFIVPCVALGFIVFAD